MGAIINFLKSLIQRVRGLFKSSSEESDVPAGLQIFNTSGDVVFDSSGSDRYGRLAGSFTIPGGSGTRSGSVDLVNIGSGTAFCLPTSQFRAMYPDSIPPPGISVRIEGSKAYWVSEMSGSVTVFYGVF